MKVCINPHERKDFPMINWNNMDKLASYQALAKAAPICLASAMAGEGAQSV